jgi:hypothetical protein
MRAEMLGSFSIDPLAGQGWLTQRWHALGDTSPRGDQIALGLTQPRELQPVQQRQHEASGMSGTSKRSRC